MDLGQPKRQGTGDGTLTSRSIPVRVTGGPAYIADISAGRDFAAATGTNSEVWSWGSDDNGQVQVTGLTIAAQIAAGGAAMYQRGRMRLCPDTRPGLSGRGA